MNTSHAVIVYSIGRLTNTQDGNPRYSILTSAGNYQTEPDTQAAGTIDPTFTGRAVLTINEKGTITDLQPTTTD